MAFDVKGRDIWTPTQKAELLATRTRLIRQLARFRVLQAIYMSAADKCLSASTQPQSPTPTQTKRKADEAPGPDESAAKPIPVELQQLYLPSELTPTELTGCYSGLAEIEAQMREAQCHNTLDAFRTHLYIKSALLTYKERNVRHQGMSTRARSIIDLNEIKIKILRDRYNIARAALISLKGEENVQWRFIADEDVRCLEDREVDERRQQWALQREKRQNKNLENSIEGAAAPGEGFRKVSWIWESTGPDAALTPGLHEGGHFVPVFKVIMLIGTHSCTCGMGQGSRTSSTMGRGD